MCPRVSIRLCILCTRPCTRPCIRPCIRLCTCFCTRLCTRLYILCIRLWGNVVVSVGEGGAG